MSAPAPVVPLAFQTSAIHGNTLFTFQPDAFQSLDLSSGSKWNQLPMGVSVNGSQAVVAQSGGQDVLFVIGGRSNSSETQYPGLQKFNFGSNSWQQLQPQSSVSQNRVQHGAAFLQSTKSILIYGGSQDNSYSATSQTYTISADEPYTMKSYPAGAPLVQDPILMPYNASHAILAGGGPSQDQIWLFSEATGWQKLDTTIPGGVGDASKVQGALITDGSGNKQLELFDMSVSPNTVKKVGLSDQISKRNDIDVRQSAPANSPTATRNGFSLAQSGNTVVLSGGTQDKSAGPLAIFDQGADTWKDNQAVFGSSANTDSSASNTGNGANGGNSNGSGPTLKNNIAAGSSSAPAASGSVVPASSGAPPASSGAASVSGASSAAGATSAGATSAGATATNAAASASGSASGSAAASATAAGAQATGAGASGSAAAIAAASSSAAAAPSGGPSSNSTSIILAAVLGSFFGIAAIFLAALLFVRYRRNKAKQEQQRQDALDEKRAGSPASSVGTVNGKKSPFQGGQQPTISRPQLLQQNQAEDLASPRRLNNDEGWSRYFANNNTVDNLYPGAAPNGGHAGALAAGAAVGAAAGVGAAAVAGHAGARDTAYTQASDYTVDSPRSSHNGHESALIVPPLSTHHSRNMSNSTIPEESATGHENWDPTSTSGGYGSPQRPASSIYYDRASSVYPTNPLSPDVSNFPPVPPINTNVYNDDKGMRSIISTDFGADAGSGDGYNFPESPARRVAPGSEPRSAGNATGRKEGGGDLSWVTFQQ